MKNLPGVGETFKPLQVAGSRQLLPGEQGRAAALQERGDLGLPDVLPQPGVQLESKPPSTAERILRPVGGLLGLDFHPQKYKSPAW